MLDGISRFFCSNGRRPIHIRGFDVGTGSICTGVWVGCYMDEASPTVGTDFADGNEWSAHVLENVLNINNINQWGYLG